MSIFFYLSQNDQAMMSSAPDGGDYDQDYDGPGDYDGPDDYTHDQDKTSENPPHF